MELKDAKLTINGQGRETVDIDGAPIKTSHPCQKCGKPVNLLDDKPRATLRYAYTDAAGNKIGETGFEAVHVDGCPTKG